MPMTLPTISRSSRTQPPGTVITFYSFKGGVGRSMALANLAVLFARAGKRVLCVDWDLEAPGLDRYFRAAPPAKSQGAESMSSPLKKGGLLSILETSAPAQLAPWRDYLQTRTGYDGTMVELLASGDDADDYSRRLSVFTWADYFAHRQGGDIIEALRDEWKANYDYVLVDSRTGLTDSSGICTIQMPDLLVMLFAANDQNIDWSRRVARSIRDGRSSLQWERTFLNIVPVLSRFDAKEESERAGLALDRIAKVFEPYYADWLPSSIRPRDMLPWTLLPYVPRYSFEEALAVDDEPETGPQGLAYYYRLLSKLILGGIQNVRKTLESVGVPGAALPPLIPPISELQTAMRREPQAMERYRDVVRQHVDDVAAAADALQRLASACRNLGRDDDAKLLVTEAETLYANPEVGQLLEIPRESKRGGEEIEDSAIRIFVSYSHLDREWFGKLRPLLKFNALTRVTHAWHDQELRPGDRWTTDIKADLQQMDVFVCLVSYNFLNSDFIEQVEMKEALRREEQGKTVIVPVLISDMEEKDIGYLKPFNPLPEWGRSWRSYEKDGGHTMDAHKPIRTGLWQAIEKAIARKPARV